MSRFIWLVAWILAGWVLIAPGTLAEDAATDPLAGEWLPIAMELGADKLPDAVLKATKLSLKGGFYEVTVGRSTPDRGKIITNQRAVPKTMDIIGAEGPNKGKTILAIYEIKDDQLTICYALTGEKRPDKFATGGEKNIFLAIYKRKTLPVR